MRDLVGTFQLPDIIGIQRLVVDTHVVEHGRLSAKQIINGYPPPRYGRFCFCKLTATASCGVIRITRAIDLDRIVAQQIYIPHHLRSTGEVVGSFRRHRLLHRRAVVVLTADFDRKDGRPSRNRIPARGPT